MSASFLGQLLMSARSVDFSRGETMHRNFDASSIIYRTMHLSENLITFMPRMCVLTVISLQKSNR